MNSPRWDLYKINKHIVHLSLDMNSVGAKNSIGTDNRHVIYRYTSTALLSVLEYRIHRTLFISHFYKKLNNNLH